ncbi:hypothetical protein WE348_21520 (plasmid) [Alteromonas macleodii]|uniref:hypothetical protein n=1 Tax=Alteromonas macleodii TaxID=28108 RepID=UPI0030CF3694
MIQSTSEQKYYCKVDNFNFQFMCNQTNIPMMVSLPSKMFVPVEIINDVAEASFTTTKYEDNKCYDNVAKTLLKNISSHPDLMLCIGLHQCEDKPEQIVEHCWFEYNGVFYDFLQELPKARYHKYVSFNTIELMDVMDSIGCDTVPNIIQFYSWAQHKLKIG